MIVTDSSKCRKSLDPEAPERAANLVVAKDYLKKRQSVYQSSLSFDDLFQLNNICIKFENLVSPIGVLL